MARKFCRILGRGFYHALILGPSTAERFLATALASSMTQRATHDGVLRPHLSLYHLVLLVLLVLQSSRLFSLGLNKG